MKYIIALLSLFILIISCNQKQEKHFSYTLSISDSINISNTPDNNYFAYFTKVIDSSGKTYLLRDNYNANGIMIYDWGQKKLIKKRFFKPDGPDGIASFGGAAVYPITMDSLIIIDVTGITTITKGNKVMYRKKNLIGDDIYRSYGLNPYKPQKINNSVYFWRASDYRIDDKKYYDRDLYFKYNLKDHSLSSLNIYYPPFVKKEKWNSFQAKTYFTKKGQDLLIGFGTTPLLYKYNTKKRKVTDTIRPAYGSFPTKIDPVKNNENRAIRLKRSSFYNSIEYDPYRKLFYRFFFTPVAETQKVNSKFDFWLSMPFTVQVLDEKFNLLTERKFKRHTYNLRDYFVTKEGLWISTNNPDNPDFDEDRLQFKLFQLKQVNKD